MINKKFMDKNLKKKSCFIFQIYKIMTNTITIFNFNIRKKKWDIKYIKFLNINIKIFKKKEYKINKLI